MHLGGIDAVWLGHRADLESISRHLLGGCVGVSYGQTPLSPTLFKGSLDPSPDPAKKWTQIPILWEVCWGSHSHVGNEGLAPSSPRKCVEHGKQPNSNLSVRSFQKHNWEIGFQTLGLSQERSGHRRSTFRQCAISRLSLSRSTQGSIQQLVLRSDPGAADDQCEDDDPYASGDSSGDDTADSRETLDEVKKQVEEKEYTWHHKRVNGR
ncbi:hypothetical protein Z043_121512 [Scleropages formosus]|uniref:Uncharacterized protein n=1 Tax=Scleropages formosus TaxID=113540 RepID=A0A0P7THX8_SCLFO|nr:hypothetical protein Z043_121512 [Scleropages formosus]